MHVNLADEWEHIPILYGKTIFQVAIPPFDTTGLVLYSLKIS